MTELEILHGILNNPEMSNRVAFYFRDPAYVDHMPPDRRGEFCEQDSDRCDRLLALKDRIRASALACRENYPDPKTLGQWVLEDLTVAINEEFPPGEVAAPLDRDAADHNAFARSRTGVYIGRPEYFHALDAHAATDGQPLVVLGESGSGKSALLANWALRYRQEHPDVLLVMHFIGATPYSADWAAMLRRIMGELKRRFQIAEEIPNEPDALRAAFANWLHMAAARGRVVLILDALNQLEDRDGAPDMVWLSSVIPANVRIVFSTLPGRPLDDLEKRGWPTLDVQPLETDERRRLVADYLAQFTKKLNDPRTERIASAPQAANPLYLRALLDELRVFGAHEQLDQRIGHYLEAQTVPELYERVLERWETDYERDRAGLVRETMTALWAARRGLAESELLEVLGTGGQPLPRAVWSPLFLAMADALVSRSGLLTFSHDFLRTAARDTYVPTDAEQQQAHLRLAEFFQRQSASPHRYDELPWQLVQASSWERASDVLADKEMFAQLWLHSEYDLKNYWARIEEQSPLRAVTAYEAIRSHPGEYCEEAIALGSLLRDLGYRQESLAIFIVVADHLRDVKDKARLTDVLSRMANLLRRLRDYKRALQFQKERQVIYDEAANRNGSLDALYEQLQLNAFLETYDEFIARFYQFLQQCRSENAEVYLALTLGMDAEICATFHSAVAMVGIDNRWQRHPTLHTFIVESTGIPLAKGQSLADRAEDSLRDQDSVLHTVVDTCQLLLVLEKRASSLQAIGQSVAALECLRRLERVARQLEDHGKLLMTLNRQATILAQRGEAKTTLETLMSVEVLATQIGDKAALGRCLLDQATLLMTRLKDRRGALAICTRACKIFRAGGFTAEYRNAEDYRRQLQLRLYKSPSKLIRGLTACGSFGCIGGILCWLEHRFWFTSQHSWWMWYIFRKLLILPPALIFASIIVLMIALLPDGEINPNRWVWRSIAWLCPRIIRFVVPLQKRMRRRSWFAFVGKIQVLESLQKRWQSPP